MYHFDINASQSGTSTLGTLETVQQIKYGIFSGDVAVVSNLIDEYAPFNINDGSGIYYSSYENAIDLYIPSGSSFYVSASVQFTSSTLNQYTLNLTGNLIAE